MDCHECEVGEDENNHAEGAPKGDDVASTYALAEENAVVVEVLNTHVAVCAVVVSFFCPNLTILTIEPL